jgi:hypothetical protein
MILSGIHDFSVLETGFRLKAYRNDNFFWGSCKRLGSSCLSKVTALMELSADFTLIFAKFVIFFLVLNREAGIIFVPGVQARWAGCKALVVGF